jgi:hypothetical protein
MIELYYLNTLRKICAQLNNCQNSWVVTGSLGMALQGVDIEVHDIDIQTNPHEAHGMVHFSASK